MRLIYLVLLESSIAMEMTVRYSPLYGVTIHLKMECILRVTPMGEMTSLV